MRRFWPGGYDGGRRRILTHASGACGPCPRCGPEHYTVGSLGSCAHQTNHFALRRSSIDIGKPVPLWRNWRSVSDGGGGAEPRKPLAGWLRVPQQEVGHTAYWGEAGAF